jgi:hypothetical protein
VANLNDEQLDQLENILAKDLDSQSEFSMLLEGKIKLRTVGSAGEYLG